MNKNNVSSLFLVLDTIIIIFVTGAQMTQTHNFIQWNMLVKNVIIYTRIMSLYSGHTYKHYENDDGAVYNIKM